MEAAAITYKRRLLAVVVERESGARLGLHLPDRQRHEHQRQASVRVRVRVIGEGGGDR